MTDSDQILLAIETSTQSCSAALLCKGDIQQEYILAPRDHTRLIMPMIDQLLGAAKITLSQVQGLAFTRGPGSFTGLRIGFGIVQGLAYGADIPVVPVCTLDALAQRTIDVFNVSSGAVVTSLDARMGEIYWRAYKVSASDFSPLSAPAVSSPDRLESILSSVLNGQEITAAAGSGWAFLENKGLKAAHTDSLLMPDARSVLKLAQPLFTNNKAQSIDEVELLYVRDEISWKKRQKIRQDI